MNKPTTMQKYLLSEKGKAAKRKANDKWRTGRAEKISQDDIKLFIKLWCEKKCEGRTDADLEANPCSVVTATELWHEFGKPKQITRKLFISYLPALPEVASYMRQNKRVYAPAYKIDLLNWEDF